MKKENTKTRIRTRLKKNDTVKVIAGNAKGTVGKILFINKEKGRVIVEGVNIINRHTKPNQKNQQGGIIKKEAPIHISNVMLMDPKSNQPTRIGMQLINDPNSREKKMRVGKSSGEAIIS